MVARHTSIP